MASTTVYQNNKAQLMVGLEWRVLASGKSLASALRETGGEVGATHACVCSNTSVLPDTIDRKGRTKKSKPVMRHVAGFFNDASGDSKGPPKGSHSLAAAFTAWTSASEYNSAVLCVKVEVRTKNGSEVKYAVCVNQDGVPVFDELKDSLGEAKAAVSAYRELDIFSDDAVTFPNSVTPANMLDSDTLLASITTACNKKTLISSIPANVALYVGIAALALGLLYGYNVWQNGEKVKAKQAALAQAAQADPLPRYIAALALQRANVGVTDGDLKQALSKAATFPMVMTGWQTKRIECSQANGCSMTLVRKSGTTATLLAKAQALGMTMADTKGMNLDEAVLTWTQTLTPSKVSETPTLKAFLQGSAGSTLQVWKSAGLAVQIQPSTLWPSVPGMPANTKTPEAVVTGGLEINGIALPQLREVLSAPAANIVWSGWSIDTDPSGSDVLAQAKARVFGAYYAKP